MTNPIPATGYLRLRQIIGDKKAGVTPIFPVGATTWWNGVKVGRYPKAYKIGPRATAWRAEDIRALISGKVA
ncbi:MAG: AlpA family phage regulatory protein [Betaproteobacteria bacterium]